MLSHQEALGCKYSVSKYFFIHKMNTILYATKTKVKYQVLIGKPNIQKRSINLPLIIAKDSVIRWLYESNKNTKFKNYGLRNSGSITEITVEHIYYKLKPYLIK